MCNLKHNVVFSYSFFSDLASDLPFNSAFNMHKFTLFIATFQIVSDISAYHFTRTMDYVFAFSKFAAQGSITVRNDYQSVYKCLRALNAIPR